MFYLSWRQLITRKKQTLLVLLGISFGTLLFVSISGVQLGMREYISEQLLNNTAHVLIKGAERSIEAAEVTRRFYGDRPVRWATPPAGRREEARLQNYAGWYERLRHDPAVLDFSPRLATNAILSQGKFSASVGLIGTVPERHARITSIERYMRAGSFLSLRKGGNLMVIGSGVASRLGIGLGQTLQASTGKGERRPFKVTGIVHFGNQQFDESIAFVTLADAQSLDRSPGRVTQIAVALYDIDRSSEAARTWRLYGTDEVQDWREANKVFMEMIQVQDFTRYFITISILIVAAFGIYNVLTITINQKRKEIAILRAIGYGPRRILELVLYQGLLLGVSGGALGLALGLGLCLWIGSIDFGFEIGGSTHLRVVYDWKIYATAFASANLTSFVASYLPARSASRLSPMDIVRSS